MNVLVVPTIREECIHEFLNSWDEHILSKSCTEIVIVEDNPEQTFSLIDDDPLIHRYSWEEIDKELQDRAWVISRHDAAIKSFGFWKAYQMGADNIFVMDDDCLPVEGHDFIKDHLTNLNETPRWIESVPGQRTRGIPYHNKGKMKNVVLSVGLWEGVPDFDSVYALGANPKIHIELPEHNRLVAAGQYYPMCGMNICFKREITPLMYFPPMGDGQPFRRFDDIWCGIISKKIMDHLDYKVCIGKPFVHHKKASNVFSNLKKEAPGIVANETFWEMIDNIPLAGQTPVECMDEIGVALSIIDDEYFKKLGQAIRTWTALFANP